MHISNRVEKVPDDLLRVLVEGRERAELLSLVQEATFLEAEISGSTQEGAQYADTVREAMYRGIHGLFHQYCMESGKVSRELAAQIMNIENLEELMTQISVNISLTWQNKQKLLEAATLEERYEVLGGILQNEIEVFKVGQDLQKKLKLRVDKNQREYILREQLKLIREELGEESVSDMADEYGKNWNSWMLLRK